MTAEIQVVLSTFPGPDKAAEVAQILVEEQLAACVNLVPQVRSIYAWEGKLCDELETLAIMKTTADRAAALADRILALHPYETPEVIVLPVVMGSTGYVAWVAASVAR